MVAFFCKIVCIKCSLYGNNLYICDVAIKQYDIKLMKITLEKQSKWDSAKADFRDHYWIRVDGIAVDLTYDEISAKEKYDHIKLNYQKREAEILLTEEI